MLRNIYFQSLLLGGLLFAAVNAVSADNFITIGTGGVTGVYYPTGGAICSLVNKGRKKHGLRCSVESTGGSVYNLNSIRAGELDIGVAQSDWQYHAYHGSSKFADKGPNKDLRALFSMHPEPFTVLARADSGVKTFADLKGKRVNIGNPGSGQRGTMEVLMKKLGWSKDDFALTSELKAAEQSKALCDNKVDVIIYAVGHPNGSIKEATTSCDSKLISVTGPIIDSLIAKNNYYRSAVIPAGMYSGNEADVKTFGVGATVVTSSKLSDDAAYQVVKAVFENFKRFRKLHPSFNHLDKKQMISDALSAPIHNGAMKYYKEQGWM